MRRSCSRPSACDTDEAVLQLCEPAGANGELIQEENRKDDPADGKESVAGAEAGGEEGQAHGHVKDDESDCKRRRHASQGGEMALDSKARHGDHKHDQG